MDVFSHLGHPLLTRIAECFVKAAGIEAVQAVSREAYFSAVESANGGGSGFPTEVGAGAKRQPFPHFKGMAAGMYSGLTYGQKEKNSAMSGAVTRAALALTLDDHSHEQVVQCAITGAAISTAANLLSGIF